MSPEKAKRGRGQGDQQKSVLMQLFEEVFRLLFRPCTETPLLFFALLVVLDLLLCQVIIRLIPYTEIDWKAYMQEVEFFLNGERNYYNMYGDTGPLVYPAGFVYIYSALYRWCDSGSDIGFAQQLFVWLNVVHLLLVILAHRKSKILPFGLSVFFVLSRRVHSIFLLRLFNDAFAMTFLWGAVASSCADWYAMACVLFSLGVSVKMNVLLFAPGFLFLLWRASGKSFVKTCLYLGICAVVQLVLGLPFLVSFPVAYLHRAFELGRVFTFKWSVNWQFVPEHIFVSKQWGLCLLVLHLSAVVLFWLCKWERVPCGPGKQQGGTGKALRGGGKAKKETQSGEGKDVSCRTEEGKTDVVLYVMATSQIAGIVFARSLHYQFYSWYFHTLPFLLAVGLCPALPTGVPFGGHSVGASGFSVLLLGAATLFLGAVEVVFNLFPPSSVASLVLLCLHLLLLFTLLIAPFPRRRQQSSLGSKKTT
uniref:dolichyl-P-Man:Man5GlcNAc2-PP-dolichol alpha-1,3-mannosyltransferase n=1 Tax=Chromera velia CCMP2878 TaxID=1169474 RepID=A0A0G4FVH6_9ALVE|eukprot:Cvel_3783.t1-p1 / transcript=Cvel_3783.t1 / gene=Cvel_3783 / organism=Chromera_velia_CCMP2878 / gene_product=Dol-P-Man:Man(5)GlcNAc(2)-PP-Dol, putative / transcript_product=Dol-P-Man:Man(5)GlcNAc(2)-PP-Dol, putative / location=Cvel_scaffold158:112363-114982(+) / protein_length=476 / sequence_SO=supercontig / SO=protein_coding / is_pseudo=false